MRSVYLKTLHDLRGLTLAWGVGLAVLSAVNVVFFPTFSALPEMMSFLENLPPVLKSFLGDLEAVMTLEGFLKIKVFDVLPLLLGIFGIGRAAQALTGELEHKTADLLLALPVRRERVVIEKFLAIATAMSAIAAATALGLVVSCAVVGAEARPVFLWLGAANGAPLALVFTALALFGSATLRSSRRASVLAGSVMAAAYVFETVRLVSPSLSGWYRFSPFAHHRDALGFGATLEAGPSLVFAAAAVVLALCAAIGFARRDLRG